MNHNAMQGIGDWALPLKLSDLNNLRRTATYYKVFCRLSKLIKVKSATLQRFHLAFKYLLLLEKNSRLHLIFQDFAFNFHTFPWSEKVVHKFLDFFKNSKLCTNPVICIIQKCKYLLNEKRYFKKENAILLFFEKPFK